MGHGPLSFTSSTMSTPSAQDPEVWQIQEFYALARETGMDLYVDAILAMRNEKAQAVAAVYKAGEERPKPEAVTFDELEDAMDSVPMDRMFKVMCVEGGYNRLVRCIMGLHPDDHDDAAVGRIKASEVDDAFGPFVSASVRPMSMLMGFAAYIP